MSDTPITHLDTPGRALPPHRTPGAIFIAFLVALCLGGWCAGSDALELPLNAKVVWAGDGTAVIASDEPLALAAGDLVRFIARGKPVAEGLVLNLIVPRVAVVGLGSDGSLAGVKKLDRLRLLADRRSLHAPGVLRVGYPSGSRGNLLFDCGLVTPRASGSEGVYRTETLTDHRLRLVRDPEAFASGPWPDTLLVRLFDDSADEEIAWERGDLDVAVFWPGELSPHARGVGQTKEQMTSDLRARGLLGAIWLGSDAGGDPVVHDPPKAVPPSSP